jgi:hypothetical protein
MDLPRKFRAEYGQTAIFRAEMGMIITAVKQHFCTVILGYDSKNTAHNLTSCLKWFLEKDPRAFLSQ